MVSTLQVFDAAAIGGPATVWGSRLLSCAKLARRGVGGDRQHGRIIPNRPTVLKNVVERFEITVEEVKQILVEARQKLFGIREREVKPFRDERTLTN